MEIHTAHQTALRLMGEHNLLSNGWIFQFDGAKRRAGLCDSTNKIISLSRAITHTGTDEGITNTILHEIAHALVGCQHGHNNIWRAKALSIGCSGKRTHNHKTAPSKYSMLCLACGDKTPSYRKPKRNSSCAKCCPRYNEAFKLVRVRT